MLDYNDHMNKSIHFFHWNINILHMSIVKIIAAKNFARSAARSHLSSAFCLKIGVKFFRWKIEKFQKIKNFQKNRNIQRNRKIDKNRKFPIISGPNPLCEISWNGFFSNLWLIDLKLMTHHTECFGTLMHRKHKWVI